MKDLYYIHDKHHHIISDLRLALSGASELGLNKQMCYGPHNRPAHRILKLPNAFSCSQPHSRAIKKEQKKEVLRVNKPDQYQKPQAAS